MDTPPGAARRSRHRLHIHWELVACGLVGHVLLGVDARELRERDSLIAREGSGVRWHRCLRCDSWIALEPPLSPGASHPPDRDEIEVPLRGKALRDRVVLRLIAVDRALHFLVLGLLGIAVLVFAAHRNSLRGDFYRIVTALQSGVGGGPVQQSGHTGILHELGRLFTLDDSTLEEIGIVLLAYAALEAAEAVGLWLGKRWAEYLTFIATSLLLIPEVYELIRKLTVLRLLGFGVNVAVVVYLLFAKRLFGLRGGGAVDERERAAAMSWEAIERATPAATP